jgi:hypothetical protein
MFSGVTFKNELIERGDAQYVCDLALRNQRACGLNIQLQTGQR